MRARPGERGYALAALLAAITIMMIALAAALPSWKYVVKNEREEELLFRGGQIADAIKIYQRKRGNALPTSIDLLVKEKCLRKAYKDPMTKDGKWRLLRPGEVAFALPGQQRPGARPSPSPSPGAGTSRPGGLGGPQTSVGPFNGVASLSTEKSLRLFVGQDQYNKWLFIANQPRWVGKPPGPRLAPGVPRPSATPRK